MTSPAPHRMPDRQDPHPDRPHLLLVAGLGLFALLRSITRIVEGQLGLDAGPVLPIAMTALITVVWVAVVGLGSAPRPFTTLVLAGLVYAVAAMLLSAVLSPILDGELSGPLTNPLAIVPLLAVNAAWGAIAGLLALVVRSARADRRRGR